MSKSLKIYPEQSPYVKGKKIWLELENDKKIVVSSQARDIIKLTGINEELFISKLKELFADCLTNLDFPFHTILVSKASDSWEKKLPYLRVDLKDQWRGCSETQTLATTSNEGEK